MAREFSVNRIAFFQAWRPLFGGYFTSDEVRLVDDVLDRIGVPRDDAAQTMSDAGIGMLKTEEGSVAMEGFVGEDGPSGRQHIAYDDARPQHVMQPGEVPHGTLTIGYGHTGNDVMIAEKIGEQQATALLKHDVATTEQLIQRVVTVPLNQNQFDALVMLAYNIGPGAFEGSSLLKVLNAGDYASAAEQFAVWNETTIAGKKQVSDGLTARRGREAALFSTWALPTSPTA